MSEYNSNIENINENTELTSQDIPANLAEGESVIPHELLDKYKEAVEELNLKNDGLHISKPKEMPETDENNIIGSSGTERPGGARRSALAPNENGILSSAKVDVINSKQTKAVKKEKVETTAIFSSKNVTWSGVGKVYRGYNIVPKEQAEKWLKRDHIRLATPEEIKQEFNK
jgi:hypothetical protein